MQPDQPAQGSTADYCSRWPGEPHAISTHIRNGIAVRRCDSCGWIDFDDLRAQQHTAYDRGLAEGRRQATEGARELTRRWWWPGLADARQDFERLVGPWEPDEQPEAEEGHHG